MTKRKSQPGTMTHVLAEEVRSFNAGDSARAGSLSISQDDENKFCLKVGADVVERFADAEGALGRAAAVALYAAPIARRYEVRASLAPDELLNHLRALLDAVRSIIDAREAYTDAAMAGVAAQKSMAAAIDSVYLSIDPVLDSLRGAKPAATARPQLSMIANSDRVDRVRPAPRKGKLILH